MTGHSIPGLFEEYVIDANIFINFWRLSEDEPFGKDVHSSAWTYLEQQIEAGRVITPYPVRTEILKHGPPELHAWVKKHENMFVPLGNELTEPLRIITKLHKIYKTGKQSNTDPIIIALAKARNLCVITSEKHEPEGNRSSSNPKIPNVCDDVDVNWVSATGFFRKEKKSF